jgi:hypothetical protein
MHKDFFQNAVISLEFMNTRNSKLQRFVTKMINKQVRMFWCSVNVIDIKK